MIHSPTLKKGSGIRRCYACDRTISRNKILCMAHAKEGEESMKLIVSPHYASNAGKIFIYECQKCGRQTVAAVRDPGIIPLVWGCFAMGEDVCAGPSIISGRVPSGPNSPKPEYEFYRPVGHEYREQSSGQRELLDMGILDWRRIDTQFIQSPPRTYRAVPRY